MKPKKARFKARVNATLSIQFWIDRRGTPHVLFVSNPEDGLVDSINLFHFGREFANKTSVISKEQKEEFQSFCSGFLTGLARI